MNRKAYFVSTPVRDYICTQVGEEPHGTVMREAARVVTREIQRKPAKRGEDPELVIEVSVEGVVPGTNAAVTHKLPKMAHVEICEVPAGTTLEQFSTFLELSKRHRQASPTQQAVTPAAGTQPANPAQTTGVPPAQTEGVPPAQTTQANGGEVTKQTDPTATGKGDEGGKDKGAK